MTVGETFAAPDVGSRSGGTAAPSREPARSGQQTRVRPYLVAPRLDAWLVGGIGIVAWVLMIEPFGSPLFAQVPQLGGAVLWGMLAITGTHFGISYHLAYGQGRSEVRRRWPQLIAVPTVLTSATVAVLVAAANGHEVVAAAGVRLLLVAVFTLTGWHYLKQVYGVARLFASVNGLTITSTEAKVLRYGLYPLWFLNASVVWMQDGNPTQYGFAAGFGVIPTGLRIVLMLAAIASLVVVGGAFVALGVRWGQVPPAAMWTPYLAGYLWFVWRPGHISALVVLGALHGMQYLVCAHRAELAWAAERHETRPAVWWVSVFGGALSAGMMLSYWMPMWLGDSVATYGLGTTAAALLFAFFNLHHYAVDNAIWRSRDGHVRRIVASARSGA